jgi:hypothetical protein
VHAVGADDDVARDHVAVGEGQGAGLGVDGRDGPPEVQVLLARRRRERAGERLLQVDAVHAPVGRAEALSVGVGTRVRSDPRAAAAVAVDQLGGLGGDRVEGLPDAETVELAGAVGRQRDGRAHLAQLVGLLVEVDLHPCARQRDAEGEAADPGSCDDDAGHVVLHLRSAPNACCRA